MNLSSSKQMLGELISLQDSHKSFSCQQDAVKPQSKLVVSHERDGGRKGVGGQTDREQGEKQPFISCLCPSVRAQQLQLCSINCEEEPLSATVNALL